MDAVAFVGVVDVAERVVDGDGFDLPFTAEDAEFANFGGLQVTAPVVLEPVLPEVALAWSGLAADDGKNSAVARALVERYAHWSGGFPLLAFEDRDTAGNNIRHAAGCDREHAEALLEAFGEHGNISGFSP
jgi:hypothetical protein